MNKSALFAGTVLISASLQIVPVGRAAPTTSPSDPASALLQQIKALKAPSVDPARQDDQKYVQSTVEASRQWLRQGHALISEFFTRFPNHPQAKTLMTESLTQMGRMGMRQEVMDETAALLSKTTDPKFKADILFARASANFFPERSDQARQVVEDFVQVAPEDDRGGELLTDLARSENDGLKQKEIYQRVAERYAASRAGQAAKGMLRQTESIGKPFELTFTDAISGKEISIQRDLKGKVVVIDFWATWCGPCVAEMPRNKEIYTRYKDKGVEFIGVSLDVRNTGLKALNYYVTKNDITWPQYYQGNQWQSEFSTSWGINEIPTVFIIDKEGKLYSVKARGQLETLIPKLLASPVN